jgi:hypothetical protein
MIPTPIREGTARAGAWRGAISGACLLVATVWSIFQGRVDAAVFAGIAALWAFLYAARTAQLRDTEREFAAFRNNAGRDDA